MPELQARLFAPIFWSLVAMAVVGLVLTGALMDNNFLPRATQLLLLMLTLTIWVVHRRGFTGAASNLMIWGFWGFSTLVVLSEAGRASPWLVPQFLLVVVARFLLNGRVAIGLGLTTALLDYAIYHFDVQALMPMQLSELTQGNDWAALVVSFLFLMFIFFLTDTVLRETLRQSRFNQGRYQSLFDNTNDAVFLINTDLSYLDANEQAANLLGLSRAELVGKSIFDIVVPEEAAAVRSNFHKLDKEGALPFFERTLVRSDGSRRTAEVSITVVPDEAGNPRYYQSVMRDISERKRLEEDLRYSLEEMESLAMQDPLTSLLNRRAILDHADAEWHRARREKRPLCIALIDLDNLKNINDTLGHMVGDKAILALATAIKESRRRYDWVGRWGGDEFMLVLPGTNLVDAQEICERLRAHYAQSEIVSSLDAAARPHLSVGIACFSGRPGDETTLNQLFAQADQALYSAKEKGKDRVEVYRTKQNSAAD